MVKISTSILVAGLESNNLKPPHLALACLDYTLGIVQVVSFLALAYLLKSEHSIMFFALAASNGEE